MDKEEFNRQNEYVRWQISQDDKLRDDLTKTTLDAQWKNLDHIRKLLLHLSILSSGIIGFSVPVFSTSHLIRSSVIFSFGLFCLLIVVVYTSWYLAIVLQRENVGLVKFWKQFDGYLTKQNKARNEFFLDMSNKESYEKWKAAQREVIEDMQANPPPPEKPDHTLNAMMAIFTTGIILIFISILDIASLFQIISR